MESNAPVLGGGGSDESGFDEGLHAVERFERSIVLPVSAEEAFAWHARPGAFDRLNPPWQYCEVIEHAGDGIRDGARLHLRVGLAGPVRVTWKLEHYDYDEGRQFRDVQSAGPFAHWSHTHRIEPIANDGNANDGNGNGPDDRCRLIDSIEYALPMGAIGKVLGRSASQRALDRLFAYRHRVTRDDLALHAKYGAMMGRTNERRGTMRIAATGTTGLIGSALCAMLTTGGHEVIRLVRHRASGDGEVQWSTERGVHEEDLRKLEGIDAFVHLAGENIAGGRWTNTRMKRIRDSRVHGTRNLVASLRKLKNRPSALVCGSAIGYYGDRNDELLDEDSARGDMFLSQVCEEWESEARAIEQDGIRVAMMRTGIVLSPAGGALRKMLLPFKMGAGGVIGSGRQWYSWISLDDCISAMYAAIMDERLRGAVNVASPNPVTNREFTKTLGRVVHRPTLLPMPAFAARMAFSRGMANETLLASARVRPGRLIETGFAFRTPTLEEALRHELGLVRSQDALKAQPRTQPQGSLR